MENVSPRTCPCKRLPLCLSSFTAAEYGDLHSLSKQGSAVARRRDDAGYTPLHLAAQNGHVSAASLLLQLGCDVNGTKECGATPLHRASFAGAVATMKILIEWGRSSSTRTTQCDLMAVDTSFGDRMTPLHKATAGGRYLAVQLLIDSLRNLPGPIPSTDVTSTGSIPIHQSLLPVCLAALDSLGRTPLDIAIANIKIQEKEQESVARWDQVSGYSADWTKCAQLLQVAEEETAGACLLVPDTTVASSASRNQRVNLPVLQPLLPAHLVSVYACFGCEGENGGVCLTASWESSFQAALRKSVFSSLKAPKSTGFHKLDEDPFNIGRSQRSVVPIEDDDQRSPGCGEPLKVLGGITRLPDSENCANPVGPRCAQCAKTCFALHQGSGGQLVCKACKRNPNGCSKYVSINEAFSESVRS